MAIVAMYFDVKYPCTAYFSGSIKASIIQNGKS